MAIRLDLMDTPETFTQMSEPKRYGHKAIIYPKSDDDTYITIPIEESNGQWVSYTEYIMLKAELRRVVMDGISDIGRLGEQSAEIANLKAEVERLRIAGNVLETALRCRRLGWPYEPLVISEAIHRWNAAKEGKQS